LTERAVIIIEICDADGRKLVCNRYSASGYYFACLTPRSQRGGNEPVAIRVPYERFDRYTEAERNEWRWFHKDYTEAVSLNLQTGTFSDNTPGVVDDG
jgi:hypothetical protein